MKIDVTHRDGNARVGFLTTAHGRIETPVFMPVGTYGSVKGMHPERLKSIGSQIILANAYHLYLSPGREIIRGAGGIQKFSGWNGPVLTDSGGYQIFSLRESLKITDEGATFRSFLDGSEHFLTPEIIVEFQSDIGVDIAMMLDHCPPADAGREIISEAMERTTAWALRALETKRDSKTALFGIVQGGTHLDLRKTHLKTMAELDFDGLALGGFSVGEPPEVMHRLVAELGPEMDQTKPRYLMGVGRPLDLVKCVSAGIDMFDCVMPTRHARNGQLFTSKGPLNIANSRFRSEISPPDPICGCPTCKRFTLAYLSHLYRRKEILFHELATTHNLYFYLNLMRTLRDAIKLGRLREESVRLLDLLDKSGED